MKEKIQELKKVLEVYMIAEHREKEAYEFYSNAAERVSSEAEKKILLDLAAFEMQHLKMMRNNYERTLKKLQKLRQGD